MKEKKLKQKELVNKILSKEKASTITISQLDEAIGCFIPIAIVDISECKVKLGGDSLLFEVEVD